MNWKVTFSLLIASAVITFFIPLYSVQIGTASGLLMVGIRALIFIPIFLFAFALNTSFSTGRVIAQLKVFQNISYISFGILVLGLIATFIVMMQGQFRLLQIYNPMIFYLSIVGVIAQILLIVMLVKSYGHSKEVRLQNNLKPATAFDVLDDFDDEVELVGDGAQLYKGADRIKLCQVCINKKFNRQIGVVCGITDAKPTFTDNCKDYVADGKAIVLQDKTVMEKPSAAVNALGSWQGALLMSVFGFIRAAIKGFEDTFGILFFALGILWLLLALVIGSSRK
ncbi:MAG: hypothetical protein R3279_12730 [Putridiphycobacter sp.]|nr:hypothetical protein [Putridiphycobacter sp.]